MPLDELVYHGKIVNVGLIRHHPTTCHNLQLPSEDQPAEESGLRRHGEDNLALALPG